MPAGCSKLSPPPPKPPSPAITPATAAPAPLNGRRIAKHTDQRARHHQQSDLLQRRYKTEIEGIGPTDWMVRPAGHTIDRRHGPSKKGKIGSRKNWTEKDEEGCDNRNEQKRRES